MTRARREQVSLLDTPYYHCISRCVRRAFLCGHDAHSGDCFEHRRQWIVERLALLEQVFAIDITAYAIMSNHYHLVLHINEVQAAGWSDREVIERWLMLFSGPPLIRRHLSGEELTESERKIHKIQGHPQKLAPSESLAYTGFTRQPYRRHFSGDCDDPCPSRAGKPAGYPVLPLYFTLCASCFSMRS